MYFLFLSLSLSLAGWGFRRRASALRWYLTPSKPYLPYILSQGKPGQYCNIGIKYDFSRVTFARSHGRCWKPRPKAAVFNTSQGTWRMLMYWKTMFDRYYCIKTENICYISRYFLHYFVSPFHRCLANVISTDYARSKAGQYTSRNGSKSVAPVRTYWKLRSRALTARELPC